MRFGSRRNVALRFSVNREIQITCDRLALGYNGPRGEFKLKTKAKYVWDYDLAQDEFDDILAGRRTRGRLDRDWAAVRVIEWAPYQEMVRLIGFRALVDEWSRWRTRIRSEQQRRAIDFLVDWLPKHHPELLSDGR